MKGIFSAIWKRTQTYIRKILCKKNYVFRHDGPFPQETRTDCSFKTYSAFADIPGYIVEDLVRQYGQSILEMNKQEFQDNAVYWVALIDNKVVSIVFTRRGKYFQKWFVDLQPEDIAFFCLATNPEFRGRGLASSLMRYAMHATMRDGDRAYIDCRTYNKPSIKCIGKAGFTCIAKKTAIERNWALYGKQ